MMRMMMRCKAAETAVMYHVMASLIYC